MSDPKAHEAHTTDLATRIIRHEIGAWLNRHTALAEAAAGNVPLNDYERGVRQGIDHMRWGHLDNYWYSVVPAIGDALKRAGLLKEPERQEAP